MSEKENIKIWRINKGEFPAYFRDEYGGCWMPIVEEVAHETERISFLRVYQYNHADLKICANNLSNALGIGTNHNAGYIPVRRYPHQFEFMQGDYPMAECVICGGTMYPITLLDNPERKHCSKGLCEKAYEKGRNNGK